MKRIRAAGTWLYQEEIVASPPDGGYAAWSVVLGAGLISALASGLQFTFGILYVTLLEEFAQPPAATSGVVSTEFFCMLGCGVLSGRLVQRFGAQNGFSGRGANWNRLYYKLVCNFVVPLICDHWAGDRVWMLHGAKQRVFASSQVFRQVAFNSSRHCSSFVWHWHDDVGSVNSQFNL